MPAIWSVVALGDVDDLASLRAALTDRGVELVVVEGRAALADRLAESNVLGVVVAAGRDIDRVMVAGEALRGLGPGRPPLLVVADPADRGVFLGALATVADHLVWLPASADELAAHVARWQRLATSQRPSAASGGPLRAAARTGTLRLVAHDVNNPLTAIRILSEMLAADVTDPEVRRDLDDILEAADLAGMLIDSMSAMVKLEEPARVPAPAQVDLRELVREVCRRPAVRRHAVIVAGDEPVTVQVDAHLITEAFVEILLNARRMVDGRGQFEVTVGAHDGWARVSVASELMRLPHPDRDQLLVLFGVLGLRQDRAPVAATGLAAAAAAARLHGGAVAVVDRGDTGSIAIELDLPLQR